MKLYHYRARRKRSYLKTIIIIGFIQFPQVIGGWLAIAQTVNTTDYLTLPPILMPTSNEPIKRRSTTPSTGDRTLK